MAPSTGRSQALRGVYANASDLAACREELEDVLEAWLFLSISRNLETPEIDGIVMAFTEVGGQE